MSLTVSIPSSLSAFPAWKTEDRRSNQEYRLREQGLARTKCPVCGHRATLEEVTVQRPGQPTVRRQMLRCLRQVPQGASSLTAKGSRCPVQVIAEAPIDQDLPPNELQVEMGRRPATKPCEDCGADILDVNDRHYCRSCADKRKKESRRLRSQKDHEADKHPCPKCGTPCYGTVCRPCYLEAGPTIEDPAPPLPEPEAGRVCIECRTSIEGLHFNATVCEECKRIRQLRSAREFQRRTKAVERSQARAQARAQAQDQEPGVKPKACEGCGTDIPDNPNRKLCASCYIERKRELAARNKRKPCVRCGVPTLHETCRDCRTVERLLEQPEKTDPVCVDCNAPIAEGVHSTRCPTCFQQRVLQVKRESMRRKRAAQTIAPEPPQEASEEPAPVEVPSEPWEAPEEAVEAQEQPIEEDDVKTHAKKCITCGTDIDAAKGRLRCDPCGDAEEKRQRAEAYQRHLDARKPIGPCPCGCGGEVLSGNKYASVGCSTRARRLVREGVIPKDHLLTEVPASTAAPMPASVPTLPPPPPQARLSVLTLAQQVLSLSPERQQLLQRIIEEERALREEAS